MSVAPDYLEPVVAWRVWYLVKSGGETWLSSVFRSVLWPYGNPLTAVCKTSRIRLWPIRSEPHSAPGERCECGIYAATPSTIGDYLHESLWPRRRPVLGRVSLWGEVVECERGWRASLAYPEQLYIPRFIGDDRDRARFAAELEKYRVPIELLEAPTPQETIRELEARAGTLSSSPY